MKKFLISNDGVFYKANLHCHSTMSDGSLTPEQIKEHYKSLGYSVVAYTDHDLMVCHNDLTDDSFVALNGFEVEYWEKDRPAKSWPFRHECHINFIALNQETELQPFWHRSKYIIGNNHLRHLGKFDENEPDFERWYDEYCISRMMREGREKGFFVTYNHPGWSREDYSLYSKYEGMNALEIMNGSGIIAGYEDYAVRPYDELLRQNKKILAIAGDDNHNRKPLDSVYSDSGVAWTMIKAEKLNYKSITDALLKGNLYSSEGPEIHELYLEDGILTIKCSNAQKITLHRASRRHQIRIMEDKPLTEAQFNVSNLKDGYFRVTVCGLDGKQAFTNAYFPEDLV